MKFVGAAALPLHGGEAGWHAAKPHKASQTRMVGLQNLHGWTSKLAWFSFQTCMVQLSGLHGWTSGLAWFGFPECIGWKFGSATIGVGDAIRACLMRHRALSKNGRGYAEGDFDVSWSLPIV